MVLRADAQDYQVVANVAGFELDARKRRALVAEIEKRLELDRALLSSCH